MAVQIGTQLGDYRLVRELGSGTFGTVFQAEHIYIGTQVAIKVLHGQITDAERVKLRAEARNQAALEHAHIVQVLGYSEQPVPYLVMKFAPKLAIAWYNKALVLNQLDRFAEAQQAREKALTLGYSG